jgi:hypothetical protein
MIRLIFPLYFLKQSNWLPHVIPITLDLQLNKTLVDQKSEQIMVYILSTLFHLRYGKL